MTTINSHSKIDYHNARRFDNIKKRHAFTETYFQNNKVFDWKYSFIKAKLYIPKDQIVSRKTISSVVDRENSFYTNNSTAIEVNKDIQQKTLSIIIFLLIATGITLTILAITGTKQTPQESGIIIY